MARRAEVIALTAIQFRYVGRRVQYRARSLVQSFRSLPARLRSASAKWRDSGLAVAAQADGAGIIARRYGGRLARGAVKIAAASGHVGRVATSADPAVHTAAAVRCS